MIRRVTRIQMGEIRENRRMLAQIRALPVDPLWLALCGASTSTISPAEIPEPPPLTYDRLVEIIDDWARVLQDKMREDLGLG